MCVESNTGLSEIWEELCNNSIISLQEEEL